MEEVVEEQENNGNTSPRSTIESPEKKTVSPLASRGKQRSRLIISEKSEKLEKTEKPVKLEKSEKQTKSEKTEKPAKLEKSEKQTKSDKHPKSENSENIKSEKQSKLENSEKISKSENSEKNQKSENSEKNQKSENSEKSTPSRGTVNSGWVRPSTTRWTRSDLPAFPNSQHHFSETSGSPLGSLLPSKSVPSPGKSSGPGLPLLPTTPDLLISGEKSVKDVNCKRRFEYDNESAASPPSLPAELSRDINLFRMADFAQQFFRQQKTLYNKKCKIPIEKVVEHSKVIPKSSLLFINQALATEATEMLKWVMMYMGDRKPASFLRDAPEIEIARTIIKKAVDTPPLRDELFCQLVKQTNNNPSEPSMEKGWELMCMVFEAVQPSSDFEDFLIKYFQDALSSPQVTKNIRLYAIYCMKRLGQLMDKPLVPHVPYTPMLESIKEAPFIRSVFRSSLPEIMEMQEEIRPDLKIPLILKTLTEAVVIAKGLETVGIFREAAQKSELAELRKELESTCGQMTTESPMDPHIPACLLKEWMSEIRHPIIPVEFYEHITDNAENWPQLFKIIDRFPKQNRDCLFYISNFFQRIAKTEGNMMTISNLAVVISPTLCRSPCEDPMVAMRMSKFETQFVCTLLENLPQQKML